jgi:hypothetical protein
MLGEFDELYVRARSALLDAAEALAPQLGSIVLVGAQAVYLHTGWAELAVAEFTTDADFSVEPSALSNSPLLGDLMTRCGFTPREHPGGWLSPSGVYIDIMVPEALAGRGSRSADLGLHAKRAARRAFALEGALVDREPHTMSALDPADRRAVTMNVAGLCRPSEQEASTVDHRRATPSEGEPKFACGPTRPPRAMVDS